MVEEFKVSKVVFGFVGKYNRYEVEFLRNEQTNEWTGNIWSRPERAESWRFLFDAGTLPVVGMDVAKELLGVCLQKTIKVEEEVAGRSPAPPRRVGG